MGDVEGFEQIPAVANAVAPTTEAHLDLRESGTSATCEGHTNHV